MCLRKKDGEGDARIMQKEEMENGNLDFGGGSN